MGNIQDVAYCVQKALQAGKKKFLSANWRFLEAY